MNAIRTAAFAALLAALAGCSQPSKPGEKTGAGKETSPGATSASPRAVRARGCAGAIAVDLDRGETAMVDWREISADRLEAFRKRAGEAFRSAADQACRAEPKLAAGLKPIRKLVIQSGSGATEPVFYQEDGADDKLVFQYAFAEAKLGLPDRGAIEQGLRCWADPDWKACADMGD